jgi:hypothetical protein
MCEQFHTPQRTPERSVPVSMSIVEIQRISETAERRIVALRAVVALLVEVLGPFGVVVIGCALLVIIFEWVRCLIS